MAKSMVMIFMNTRLRTPYSTMPLIVGYRLLACDGEIKEKETVRVRACESRILYVCMWGLRQRGNRKDKEQETKA
jgi:hypothetical protein